MSGDRGERRVRIAGLNLLVVGATLVGLHALLAACGNTPWGTYSDDGGPTPEPEGGSSPEGSTGEDGGDASAGDDGNTPIPDGAVLPTGTQLAMGSSFQVDGVTSDGYAIYEDSDAFTLSAVPVKGGVPISIGTIDTTSETTVIGLVVFSWSKVSPTSGAGVLTIWTKANGAHVVSTASQVAGDGLQSVAVSPDGTKVLFYDNMNVAGNEASLALAGTDGADGGKIELASSLNIGDLGCFPVFGFVGSDVVAIYPPLTDGGTSDGGIEYNASVNTYTGPTYTATQVAQNAQCVLAIDPTNTYALYSTTGGLFAQDVAGANTVAIDSAGVFGQFSGAGDAGAGDAGLSVVYTDTTKALKVAPVTPTPTPTTLTAGGFTNVLSISGDGQWALANKSFTGGQNPLWDLYLASATTPATATTLTLTAVVQPVFGFAVDPFTVDSTHVLYSYPPPADGGAGAFPSLYAAPVTGGTPAPLGFTVSSAFGTSGAKIVFDVAGAYGGLDLLANDTSTSAPSTTLVSLVDPMFFLTADRSTIVYTWSYSDISVAGLYAMTAP
jgi:hypothetical protein